MAEGDFRFHRSRRTVRRPISFGRILPENVDGSRSFGRRGRQCVVVLMSVSICSLAGVQWRFDSGGLIVATMKMHRGRMRA